MVGISENTEVQVECLIVFGVEFYPSYHKQGLRPTALIIADYAEVYLIQRQGVSSLLSPVLWVPGWLISFGTILFVRNSLGSIL